MAQWERILMQRRRPGFDPWVRKIAWRRKWQPIPVFLPGEPHGQRSLAGYSPWGHNESDMTEGLNAHTREDQYPQSTACISLSLQHLHMWSEGCTNLPLDYLWKCWQQLSQTEKCKFITTWSCHYFVVGHLDQNVIFPLLLNWVSLKSYRAIKKIASQFWAFILAIIYPRKETAYMIGTVKILPVCKDWNSRN